MRDRKAFCSVAVAGTLLVAGTLATAGGERGGGTNVPTPAPSPPPLSCSTDLFDVRVSRGPTFVPCDAPGGQCTEIEYEVVATAQKKKPSHVFVLQGVGVWDVEPQGSQWYAPCEGIHGTRDPAFGRSACHEQAIKINTMRGVTRFKITLAGLRRPGPTSVAIPKGDDRRGWPGDRVSACTILGIGLEGGPNPDQLVQRAERIDFKGCVVEFTRDPVTGEIEKAQLLKDISLPGCEGPSVDPETGVIEPRPAGEIEVFLGDVALGSGKFGEGYVSTGTESCTTRVIGGRVYTWGSPCP